MKKRNIVTCCALLGLATSITPLLAQEGPGGRERERGPGGEGREGFRNPIEMMRSMPLLKALDGDKDGEISSSEIANAAVALKTLDENKDGKLTSQEVFGAMPEGGGRGGRGPNGGTDEMVNRIMALDKNSDGKVSRDELPERMQGLLERGDANHDGLLTREELVQLTQKETTGSRGPGGDRGPGGRGGPGGGMQMIPLFQVLDADHDGELSADETKNAPAALKTLDKNGDGKLTEEEMRPNFGGRGGRRGGRGPEGGFGGGEREGGGERQRNRPAPPAGQPQ